jgi:exonuclease III
MLDNHIFHMEHAARDIYNVYHDTQDIENITEEHINMNMNGDHYIGDVMQENKPPGIIRIYCININGVKWDQDGGTWPSICQAMDASNVDIIGLAELNHDVGRYELMKKFNSICTRTFQQHHLTMSTTKHKVCTTYKPGGTAALACNDMTALIKSWSRDRMGRWSTIRFSGAHDMHFTFIMAYQVCKTSSKGKNTAHAQQVATLMEEHIDKDEVTRTTPRQAFIRDLRQFIQTTQQTGDAIILCGDFNETMSEDQSGIASLATTCGLVDLFSVRLGQDNTPATYQRGHKRLDYVLLSPSLIPAVDKAGYDPFGYRIVSDHRGYFVDFQADLLCGFQPTKLSPSNCRDFQSTNSKQLIPYLRAKDQYLRQHRWYQRIHELLEQSEPDHEAAEALDRDLTRASRHAANACKFSYRSPWSPKFAQAWALINFYKLARSQISNNKDYIPSIHKLQREHPTLPTEIPSDPRTLNLEYDKAVAALKQIRQEARQHRNEFLEQKINLYNYLEEQGKAHIVQRIQRAEMMSQVYRKIKFIRNPNGSSRLSTIRVPSNPRIIDPEEMKNLPDDDLSWRTVRVPAEIETMLLDRNRRHFGQAQGTPLTCPPISMEVQYNGEGIQAETILEGNYDTTSLEAPTALFINHLQRKSLHTLGNDITTKEVIGKLQTWPEKTTTSPSGIHLGHYHAMWRPTGLTGGPFKPEEQKILDAQTALQQGQTLLLQYALKHSYSYQRWSSVVNVMLEKDPGNPRIHRLRVIHIYEADYNLLLAVKWREGLHHAEDHRLLNAGLYGSRPGRSALTPVNIEIMQNAIYQLSMKSGINLDLDATSCYDRILAKVANLASRRMGMHEKVVLVNCNTLEKAKFTIKTTIGISQDWYTHTDAFPIHGTGQGSGNSPTIWCFICSALFDALESVATGAVFMAPNKTYSVKLCMIGFVDDCSQRVNRFMDHPQPTADTLIRAMQHEAQIWNDILWVSGGALEQKKCSYHLIHTGWNRQGVPHISATTNASPLILQKPDGSQTTVNQLSNYQSHKTLGCYIEPAMTMRTQEKILRAKNEKFATVLRTNLFSKLEAWTLYTSVYLPSITFPFPNIILNESFATKMDQQFLPSLVSQCGFNQKMANAIRYAPRQHGGAGFRPLYAEWGCSTILEMIKNLRTPQSHQGKMTMIALMWAQHYIGTSFFILEDTTRDIPPCPNRYFMAMRTFLKRVDASIQMTAPMIGPRLRANDQYIMDVVMTTPWSKQKIDSINACRRYVQATTLADITNDRGTEIREDVWDGTRRVRQEEYLYICFNQQKPECTAWGIWRTFLRTLCRQGRKLRTPLGQWIVPARMVRHPTMWVFDPVNQNLYRHSQGRQYQKCSHNGHTLFTEPDVQELYADPPGYPTWVQESTRGTIRPMYAFVPSQPEPRRPVNFNEYLQRLPVWEQTLLEHWEMVHSPQETMTRLNDGPITCASDGSVRAPRASYGYVICDHTQQRLIKGMGPAHGSDPNSLRSEAYGKLATLRMLIHLSLFTGLPFQSPITHVVDSQVLIRRVEQEHLTQFDNPSSTLKAEWDVIHEIVTSMQMLPQTPTLKWIRGHQDTHTPYARLKFPAQLNCDADNLASTYYNLEQDMPQEVTRFPSDPVQLRIGGTVITSKLKSKLRSAYTKPPLQEYLCQRFQWSHEVYESVAWDLFTQIISKFRSQHTIIVKHVHAIAPTGHIAHRNKESISPGCPSCECAYEDNNHILTCPADSRAMWRTTMLHTIMTTQADRSNPALKQILHDGLNCFHRGTNALNPEPYPAHYHQLIYQQNGIGWDQLYRGRWSKQWIIMHEVFASSQTGWQRLDKDGRLWVVHHGRRILEQWLKVWELRNIEKHGHDQESCRRTRHNRVMTELTNIYQLRTMVMPCDRHVFHDSALQHAHDHTNLDTIEDWISAHRQVLEASAIQATKHGIQQNRTIEEYFPRQQRIAARVAETVPGGTP